MAGLRRNMRYAKFILRSLHEGPKRWGELEKTFFLRSGSHSRFTSMIRWLVVNGYITKDGPPRSRAPYRINSEEVSFDEDGSISIKI